MQRGIKSRGETEEGKKPSRRNKMQRSEMKMKTKRNPMETMKDNVHVQCPPNGQTTPTVRCCGTWVRH